MCALIFKNSHRPNGRLTFCSLFAQGGGVDVRGGTVSIVNSQIYSNTAPTVRAHLQKFPSPRWEIADALATTHACTTVADAPVNYSMCVLQRLGIFSSPRWVSADVLAPTHACPTANASVKTTGGACRRDLESSHRPHGRLTLLFVCRVAVSLAFPARSQ